MVFTTHGLQARQARALWLTLAGAAEDAVRWSRKALHRSSAGSVSGARRLAEVSGVLARLDADLAARSRWLRSLFSIHDFEDLLRQDQPRWTFEAIDLVADFLSERKDARVFEWGSGAGTVWLSRRAGQVVSITHDPEWFGAMARTVSARPNVRLRHVGAQAVGYVHSRKRGFGRLCFDRYARAIREEEGLFDLIVIDGRAREACLPEAAERLAPGGIILLDDYRRGRYRIAVRQSGFKVQCHKGLAIAQPLPNATAILSRV